MIQLLNDDGSASMATALMMSHHGFRRDLERFAKALDHLDPSRVDALREEWQRFHLTLHGHHEAEDNGVFPSVIDKVRATVERLSADHRQIDPLLARGDAAFEALPRTEDALAVIRELRALLAPHLDLEEREIIPFLRGAKEFPAPESEEMAKMYAEGFSWAMDGIALEVLDRVLEMLPPSLRARIPAARAAFEERCSRVWG